MKYILMDIGCIACSVPSNPVGVFTDKIEAETLASKLKETHHWRQHGENEFQVFPLLEDNVIDPEYLTGE